MKNKVNLIGNAQTLLDVIDSRAREFPTKDAYYYVNNGTLRVLSWSGYWQSVRAVATGLILAGLQQGEAVGIIAPSSWEWEIADKACMKSGGIVVGIDAHASQEQICGICEHSGVRVLIVRDSHVLKKLNLQILAQVKFIVLLEGDSSHTDDIPTIAWTELMQTDAQEHVLNQRHLKRSDPATLVYTSGTTGAPKGILYTHGQIIDACVSILTRLSVVGSNDVALCWLPLSNFFQRMINACVICATGKVAFVENPMQVLPNLRAIEPTLFMAVPRFYEKLYEGIQGQLKKLTGWKKQITEYALAQAHGYRKQIAAQQPVGCFSKIIHGLFNVTILSQFRRPLGSRMKFMISGSAPISPKLLEFYEAIGVPVIEAYGTSESALPIAMNAPNEYRLGTVGKPLPENKVRISSDGEVLLKGPGIISAYYKEETSRYLLDDDGYYHTGDYGAFDEKGFLTLKGRKSDLIKTSSGRRISPVRIESVFKNILPNADIVVIGQNRKYLVGLISASADKSTWDLPKLQQTIHDANKNLAEYERVWQWIVLPEPFTIQGSELTANLKLRRRHIEQKYTDAIEKLYSEEIERDPITHQPKVKVVFL